MQNEKEQNKSLNIKLTIIYFSILIGTQIFGVFLILKFLIYKTIFLALIASLALTFILPIVLGVFLIFIVKFKRRI
ncbi:hypothetical protein KEJ50_00020 [Candidatus Bathyarchaeota archaeon]|nr:hypothetical protein [Candidatus Bathyarchaeota archaeon]